jgi:hypothetical protein
VLQLAVLKLMAGEQRTQTQIGFCKANYFFLFDKEAGLHLSWYQEPEEPKGDVRKKIVGTARPDLIAA